MGHGLFDLRLRRIVVLGPNGKQSSVGTVAKKRRGGIILYPAKLLLWAKTYGSRPNRRIRRGPMRAGCNRETQSRSESDAECNLK